MARHEAFLREAVRIAEANVAEGGSPYGAVITRGAWTPVRVTASVSWGAGQIVTAETVRLARAP